MRAIALGGIVAALLLTACDRGDDGEPDDGTVTDLLVAIVRDEAGPVAGGPAPSGPAGDSTPATEPATLPVVYVVSTGEQSFDASVQAKVAETLRDEVDVRFADARDEAIDPDLPDEPVRDEGELVVFTQWPEAFSGGSADVLVDVYRSAADQERRVVTVTAGPGDDDDWSIASSSVVTTTTMATLGTTSD